MPLVAWHGLRRAPPQVSHGCAVCGWASVLAVAAVDELLSVARAARFANDDGLATQALMMARRRFPATPQAAMAAFLLSITACGTGGVVVPSA
jgi:hypothetical protein